MKAGYKVGISNNSFDGFKAVHTGATCFPFLIKNVPHKYYSSCHYDSELQIIFQQGSNFITFIKMQQHINQAAYVGNL
jgi:hypothetical protein